MEDGAVVVAALVGGVGGLLGGGAAVYVALRRRSIESYLAELNRVSYEHEVVFSRLHERRVDVVADLYRKLVDAERAFGSWVRLLQMAGEPPMDEKANAAAKAGEDLQTTFQRSRIWLDEDLCERIDALNTKLYHTFVDRTTYSPDDPRVQEEYIDAWKRAWDRIDQDVTPLRKEIEARFREMLGVGDPRDRATKEER